MKVKYSWIWHIIYNYGTNVDLKHATGVNTSKFATKVDLASLKSGIDKLNASNLETT